MKTGRTMQSLRDIFAVTDDHAIKRLKRAWTAGKLPWVKTPYWRRDAEVKSWLGRVFVQRTHKTEYKKFGMAINVDLKTTPDQAMDLNTASKVLFVEMRNGLFTNAKLFDFFNAPKED